AELPAGLLRPMDDVIGESVAPRRLNLLLVTAFAMIAVGLTATGLYGVMAYLVAQRTREIGVRMGARAPRRLQRAGVFRPAAGRAVAGMAAGSVGALALTRSLTSLLFGVGAAEPAIYGAVAALLATVAALAVAVPSARATRVDPLIALRDS